MKLSIPPHIAWPLFIVGLLGISISVSVLTLVMATSDGGPQVVENYYEKAVEWDAAAARQSASDSLGWEVDARVLPDHDGSGLRSIEILLSDSTGEPVESARATVRLRRPQLARPIATLPLMEEPGQEGEYQVRAPLDSPGLWDLDVRASVGNEVFLETIRVEIE